jgi:hypothetical protein
VRLGDLQAERIEPRFKVAAHAVGADQHQRPERRDGGGAHLLAGEGRGQRRPCFRLGGGCRRFAFVIVVAGRPGGTARLLQYRAGIVVQRAEQLGEGGID